MTPSPAHYIIHGESNDCEPYTPECHGKRSLLQAGEEALELSQVGATYGVEKPRILVIAKAGVEDVTEAAAAIVFEKWLADADPADYPPEWLTENCQAAADEHEARRARDPDVAADLKHDMERAA